MHALGEHSRYCDMAAMTSAATDSRLRSPPWTALQSSMIQATSEPGGKVGVRVDMRVSSYISSTRMVRRKEETFRRSAFVGIFVSPPYGSLACGGAPLHTDENPRPCRGCKGGRF